MASKEGRQQLDRIQTHHANMLVQNHLQNPIGMPQQMTPQQMPPQQMTNPQMTPQQINHQQLSMAALAPLQQQQEQMMQQYTPQIQAQLRLQQLAQANLARQPTATQAQALARAQQAQGVFQQHSAPQEVPVNLSQMQGRIPPDKLAQFKANLQKIATMTEQQREACFQSVSMGMGQADLKRPDVRNLYLSSLQHPPQNSQQPIDGFLQNNLPNLHIPLDKQRNFVPPAPQPVPQQRVGIQGVNSQDIKPYMLLQHVKQPIQAERPPQVRRTSDLPQLDRSQSLLSKVSWQPNAEHDAALKERISATSKSAGRATLGANRILGDVLLERMPEGLRAIAEDATDGKRKTDGKPGQKKRKVQELAETVDKALVLNKDVETVSQAAGSTLIVSSCCNSRTSIVISSARSAAVWPSTGGARQSTGRMSSWLMVSEEEYRG